jgi:hypothetical protein
VRPPNSHFSLVAVALNLVVSLIYLDVSTIDGFSKFDNSFSKFGKVFKFICRFLQLAVSLSLAKVPLKLVKF